MLADGRMVFESEREDLAEVVQLVFDRDDTNVAGGNISFIAVDEDGSLGEKGKRYIIMTPTMMSEAYLGRLSASQILVVDPTAGEIIDVPTGRTLGIKVDGVGDLTREINMHQAIYLANPDIKCVFHAHSKEQLFWATSGLPLPNLTEATQKVRNVEVLKFRPNCSEDLAEIVSGKIREIGDDALTHEYLLNSHGVLITTGGKDMNGSTALHKALSIDDTMEWNASIAYKQTVLQAVGVMDGYYSKGVKIGTLDDLKAGKAIYNPHADKELEIMQP
ncbi:class II aldolase/adducin family protein [Dellaglioa sp. L3N]